jgi:crotonobetaine/carnitine-CoA ligase
LSTWEPETIAEVLTHQAESLGDTPFLACDAAVRSYADLRERSLRLAASLQRLGLSQGDRVAILSENSVETVETFFACAYLGLIAVPLNIYLRGEFLRYQLTDSGCAAAVVDGPGLEAIQALEERASLEQLIVVGSNPGDDEEGVSFESLLDGPPLAEVARLTAADTAAIGYTSGTTGMPKGCVIPHGMFTQVYPVHEEAGYMTPGDRVLTPARMFHIGFLVGMLAPCLRSGASLWTVGQFSASGFMRRACEIDATVIYAVGSVGMLLLAQPRTPQDSDPGGLRLAIFQPMPPDRQLEFEERFGVPVVGENYGQSECMVIGIENIDGPRHPGSAGRPTSVLDVAVVDDEDVPVGPDQIGEIVVRPKKANMMFSGYWNKPEATLEAWRNLWHHTGDLGRQSADGTLWIVDRKKDSIRRRGENVSSLELEAAIDRHPAVEHVAVHAVPSEMGDDEVKACLVVRSDLEPTELFTFFKRELPYYAVPRYVEILDELPRTPVGRVQKQALRDRGVTATTWDFESLGLTVAREERRGGAPDPGPPAN